jgi:neogenin
MITIMWTPPRDNTILVRGYTIGWGKGIPDELTKLVDDKQRLFVIQNLSELNDSSFCSFSVYENENFLFLFS